MYKCEDDDVRVEIAEDGKGWHEEMKNVQIVKLYDRNAVEKRSKEKSQSKYKARWESVQSREENNDNIQDEFSIEEEEDDHEKEERRLVSKVANTIK